MVAPSLKTKMGDEQLRRAGSPLQSLIEHLVVPRPRLISFNGQTSYRSRSFKIDFLQRTNKKRRFLSIPSIPPPPSAHHLSFYSSFRYGSFTNLRFLSFQSTLISSLMLLFFPLTSISRCLFYWFHFCLFIYD